MNIILIYYSDTHQKENPNSFYDMSLLAINYYFIISIILSNALPSCHMAYN